jgi:hypothetical protein
MRRTKGLLISLALLLLASTALAAGGYRLDWWTANGGGGTSTGEGYQLSGTISQPDVGPALSGDGYRLEGGFWGGVLSGGTTNRVYIPLVAR